MFKTIKRSWQIDENNWIDIKFDTENFPYSTSPIMLIDYRYSS